ncbi:hypothetical protein H6G00_33250 [Leptolyngbya sp. FACHB-541]|uniref:DUF6884 domain-containing protein n=1 Tax=Leptolyngbya sp. FACHB-541 TaxID=2692810 RepID=UPI001686ECDF|nr:DUF6884 domain-containing protein [Leptolyngbya sp. FACHB-541]MBD2001408.1 hypothetical protein [Leptolyngbya sp. FACHB-541]
MPTENRRLLIVSCSRRKTEGSTIKPALERYDGPVFRLLRRFLQSQQVKQLSIYIVSAEFGLIPSTQPIPLYDRQMTLQRAQELGPDCLTKLKYLLKENSYQEICICAGRVYLQAMVGTKQLVPQDIKIRTIQGGLGRQLAELHDWLYGETIPLPLVPPIKRQQHPRLRGVTVNLTAEQILDLAQQRLIKDDKGANHYHSWYVLVGEQPVAAKWLASQVTGLSVSTFTASEARRLLAQLGIQVMRVDRQPVLNPGCLEQ